MKAIDMKTELEVIKMEKIKEAKEFFEKHGIIAEKGGWDSYEIPVFIEESESEGQEKETKLHWTRLSINSNVGVIIE